MGSRILSPEPHSPTRYYKMTASAVTAPAAQSASPVKTKSPAEIQEDANSLLATGKRHLLVGDVPAAVSCLARCCELLSAQFGETAKECAESYFYYGKSLLELSRMESGVLGNALEGVPEDSDEKVDTSQVEDPEKLTKDEKSEVEDKVAEAFDYNYKTSEIIQDEEEAAMDGAETETDGSGMEDEELQEEDMETDDSPVKKMSPKAKQDSEKKGTEDEEEPSNLQERLCSTMLHLGEVSIENENYQQAVEDIKLCLTKQEKMPKDARLRAEIHYHLGLAQAFHQQFDESIESHKAAIAILKERTKNLKVMETSSTSPRKLAETNKEIAELEALIPEIEEKIVDTKDMKKEASKQKDKSGEKGDVFGSSSTDKSTASIAIKRRSSGSESASKKTAAAV